MKTYIIGLENALASSIIDPADALGMANSFYVEDSQNGNARCFDVQIASVDGQPITCINGLTINAHCALSEIKDPDLILIAAFVDVKEMLEKSGPLIEWIKKMNQLGCIIGSICTGAYILAEAGLLNGKRATTHLAAAHDFKTRYPQVRLEAYQIVTDEGSLICSGGASSSLDLSFYLVEKYMNHSVAARCSRFFVRDLRRHSQAPYSEFRAITAHTDRAICSCQQWMEQHFSSIVTIDELANNAHMNRRTFERRFKKATGDAPISYLQKIRVKVARELLETTNDSFDEIAYRVGYNNCGAFRKIFVRNVHLLPSDYRNRFRQYGPLI